MRAAWCGFALGVWWLQRQAALPDWLACGAIAALGGTACFVARWGLRERPAKGEGAAHWWSAAWRARPVWLAPVVWRGTRLESAWGALLARAALNLATGRITCVALGGLAALNALGMRWHACPSVRFACDARLRKCVGWFALWCAAACAGFGYAALRADLRLAASLPLEWEGRDIEVVGSIRGLPSYADNGARFLFDVDAVRPPTGAPDAAGATHFPQVIQLSWLAADPQALPPRLQPGARWRLTVRLKRPHGNANFGVRDTEASLLERNVRATGYVSAPALATRVAGRARGLGVTVNRWRAALRERIDGVLADAPHRGIVVALAIGAQDAISDADWRLLRDTGTSHLVAISGLHIGFVAGLAGWLAAAVWRRSGWFGRDWPLWLPAQIVGVGVGAGFAALHAALAGFNVPAQRALWMAALVALAFVGGRNLARSTVLAWALGLVLLIDPWAVLSAGFWLSFCAVAAILFATSGRPRVRRHAPDNAEEIDLAGLGAGSGSAGDLGVGVDANADANANTNTANRPVPRNPASHRLSRLRAALHERMHAAAERLRGAVHVQLAVTVALAPLTVYWFAQIPLIGPLANAFAIPWASVLITPTVLAAVVLPAPLDAYLWHAAHTLVALLMAGLRSLSGPPWTLWWLPQPAPATLGAAAVGVFWCLAPRGWPLRWAAPLTWLPLLLPASAAPPSGGFRLTALDVGQGTSVLIETAQHALLFDAGPGPESTHAGERVVVPFLRSHGVEALDTLIVSHADSDHAGGVPAVFEAIAVRQMLAALAPEHPLWSSARQHGAQTVRCAAGQRWQWDGVEFAMLWPDPGPLRGKTNAHGCVLRVSAPAAASAPAASRVAALLSADIEAPTERVLLARDAAALRAQVLIVPHHGSRTSSTEPFLDAVEPSIAVFQVGYRNRFGHPNAHVYERYKARHIVLARSDTDGALRIDARGAGGTEGKDGVDGRNGGDGAALVLERYRETRRRYWMDR